MDTMVLVVAAIAVCVVIEMIGFRAYKRHKAKKESQFTKEHLAEVYDDLQAARAFCLAARRQYKELALRAREEGRLRDAAVLEAMEEGEKSHLAEIESFRERLHAESIDPAIMQVAGLSLDDALRSFAKKIDEWATETCSDFSARARLRGYGDIARMYKRMQEVESLYAGICLDIAEGVDDGLNDLSRCPTCGTIVTGRRPAFCTICTQPGFEFVAVPPSADEGDASGKQEDLSAKTVGCASASE